MQGYASISLMAKSFFRFLNHKIGNCWSTGSPVHRYTQFQVPPPAAVSVTLLHGAQDPPHSLEHWLLNVLSEQHPFEIPTHYLWAPTNLKAVWTTEVAKHFQRLHDKRNKLLSCQQHLLTPDEKIKLAGTSIQPSRMEHFHIFHPKTYHTGLGL